MNFKEIRSRLPEDFDPVKIWDDWQTPDNATPDSWFFFLNSGRHGEFDAVWIINSTDEFVELMSAVLFMDAYEEGLEYYHVSDEELLKKFHIKVLVYHRLHSESWNFESCRDFISNEFIECLSDDVCFIELGKVDDLLSVTKEELELCHKSYLRDDEIDPLPRLSGAQVRICLHYEEEVAPVDDPDRFLKFLSHSVLLGY